MCSTGPSGARQGTANQERSEELRQALRTSRVVGQAKRFAGEIADGVKRSSGVVEQLVLEGLRGQIEEMAPRVRRLMKQTRARIFGGDTRVEGKLLSL